MKNCILVLIFSIFLVSCKNSIYDDKNSTVMDVLIEIEKGTSISLSLHETLVHIIKGVGGGDEQPNHRTAIRLQFLIVYFLQPMLRFTIQLCVY